MKPKPTNMDELNFEQEVDAIEAFLLRHWTGVGEVRPEGYVDFAHGYCDYDGMSEWCNDKRAGEEEEFDGLDDGVDGFNFVSNVALPYVMYGDVGQGRSPLHALIAACISYGQSRAVFYTAQEVQERIAKEITDKLLSALTELYNTGD